MPKLKIADLIIDVRHDNPILKQQIDDYLTDGESDFTVALTSEDIEREIAAELGEGLEFPPAYSEYLAIYRYIATKILDFGGFLMHGSAIAKDGRAYLFCAPSGTGKSTHARLWREMLGERAIMVNDDKVFLQLRQESVWAYGSPWTGKHGIGNNISAPL